MGRQITNEGSQVSEKRFSDTELQQFEEFLKGCFSSKTGRFEEKAGLDLVSAGGKRLRPRLSVLAASFGKYNRNSVFGVAGAVELLHTASLVHDDIIDGADLRRGEPTINSTEGTHVAVYTGDFLLSKALLLLAQSGLDQAPVVEMARAIKAMCSGEIEQYRSRFVKPTPARYLYRVTRKTALLFAASCTGGAFSGKCNEKITKALGRFGLHFGIAFQIRDDILDMEASAAETGKPAGIDEINGVYTLPLLLPDGIEGARNILRRYVKKCADELDKLPNKPAKAELLELLNWLSA